ncbi:MAG TPA: hypothetical protein VK420_02000, partial [Longimicrobium sp.]|nr:hypothetical protein [Longimicrobium sp.]
FAATSYISQYSYQSRYVFPVAESVLAASIDSLRMGPYQREPAWGDTVELYIPVENCFGTMSARLVVRGGAEATDVELTQLANGCRTSKGELLRVFERCFVARLDSAVVSRASRPAQPRHLTPLGRGMKRVGCTPPA